MFPSAEYEPFPALAVPLRTSNEKDESYSVIDIDKNRVLEEVEPKRALFTLYEGGIFLHQSLSYLVMQVNHEGQFARVRRTNVEWVTRQRELREAEPWKAEQARIMWHVRKRERQIDDYFAPDPSRKRENDPVLAAAAAAGAESSSEEDEEHALIAPDITPLRQRRLPERFQKMDAKTEEMIETEIVFGDIKERAIVFGFLKLHPRTHRVIETVDVCSPPVEYVRKGIWLDCILLHMFPIQMQKSTDHGKHSSTGAFDSAPTCTSSASYARHLPSHDIDLALFCALRSQRFGRRVCLAVTNQTSTRQDRHVREEPR